MLFALSGPPGQLLAERWWPNHVLPDQEVSPLQFRCSAGVVLSDFDY